MKNRSQLLFFLLCVIVAGGLLFFLYQHRESEHAYTTKLEQEAQSQTDSFVSEDTESADETQAVSGDTAAATPAPDSTVSASPVPQGSSESTASASTASQPASSESTAASLPAGSPEIQLTTDAVTIPVGGTFTYMDYIASMTDDKDDRSTLARRIELNGSVDTSKAGTYTVTYMIRDSDGNISNQPTLTVTVQ